MHESELIQSILDGNQQDFKLLIKKYETNVFRAAIGFLHNKQDAEEITQDVFVKVYQSLSSFKGKAAFSTWLYRITVNTSLNYLRKKKRRGFWIGLSDLLQIPSKDKQTETIITERSEKIIIQHAIDKLPEKQRLAFVLSRYEELPQRQVAEIMKITEGAVEQLILRAKSNLKKKFEKELEWP
ncbi:MAG: RNA polymerase sigma factor [Chitinophagaceae bacterium]|nr:RNA polymerase sigma factor [Chitinophagaceae bacterium]MBK9484257.1 RNA polymerase sigma factor [Chitinophagaceae bacterium]